MSMAALCRFAVPHSESEGRFNNLEERLVGNRCSSVN